MGRVDTRATRWAGRISGLHFWRHYLLAVPLLVIGITLRGEFAWAPWLIVAGALLLLRALALLFLGDRWWVTQEQIVQSEGVVSRHTRELLIEELDDIEIHQSWVERLLDIGSVRLRRAGQEKAEIVLSGVRKPANLVGAIRERIRLQRGDKEI